ncbi:class I SAM-dependent methyltransferase [Micrococcaceae bacterium Sec5.7]
MFAALKKYLIIPKLVRLSAAAPKDPLAAWDQYWGKVQTTGARGEVLWDSGDDHEMLGYVQALKTHLDPELPIIDVGCGNGTFSRRLARYFPHVLGVDVSANAVARARKDFDSRTPDEPDNVSYLVCDMTASGAGAPVAAALAAAGGGNEANIFIRGVLHVLDRSDQAALARNLRPLMGSRGRIFLVETNFPGNAVEYVSHLGATPRKIPAPLEAAIRGLPMPGRFGAAQREKAFPASHWDVIEDGPTTIETVPMKSATQAELIPGYFAVLRATAG